MQHHNREDDGGRGWGEKTLASVVITHSARLEWIWKGAMVETKYNFAQFEATGLW